MNNDRLFKKTSIESLFTNDQPTNVFEEFKYIIYLSIHCIRCINILGEFENHQDLEFDSNMCILIDCDESEILLIEKLYKIPIPIFCLAYHKKYVKYLQNFTPPHLIDTSNFPNLAGNKINSFKEINCIILNSRILPLS